MLLLRMENVKAGVHAFLEGIPPILDHMSLCIGLNDPSSYIDEPLLKDKRVFVNKGTKLSNKKLLEASSAGGWKLCTSIEDIDYYVLRHRDLKSLYNVIMYPGYVNAKVLSAHDVEVFSALCRYLKPANTKVLSHLGDAHNNRSIYKSTSSVEKVLRYPDHLLVRRDNKGVLHKAYEVSYPFKNHALDKNPPIENAEWLTGMVVSGTDEYFVDVLGDLIVLRESILSGKVKIIVADKHATIYGLTSSISMEISEEQRLNFFNMLISGTDTTVAMGLTLMSKLTPSLPLALVLAYAYNYGEGFKLSEYSNIDLKGLKHVLDLNHISWSNTSGPFYLLSNLHARKQSLKGLGVNIDTCEMFKKVLIQGIKDRFKSGENVALLDYILK